MGARGNSKAWFVVIDIIEPVDAETENFVRTVVYQENGI
jgi:hypothetical protein